MKGNYCKALLVVMLVALLCSCTEPQPFEDVVIINVVFDEETGAEDYKTIVEFPDGQRQTRYGKWGETGSRFKARRGDQGFWR